MDEKKTGSSYYYGWVIVASLFVILTFSSGLGFYNHAVILEALISEKGFPADVASSAISVFFLTSGFAGLWIATVLEKRDVRVSIALGGFCSGISLALIGQVTAVWELYGLYVLFGIGFCASSVLPATTLIARWFGKKRALALSIASTGLSVGGVLITPLSAILVREEGLEVAGFVFALVYIIGVIPLSLFLLRSRPQDIGLDIDGQIQGSSSVETDGIPVRKAIRQPFFWGLSVSYLFVMMAQVGGITHQYGLVSERIPVGQAAMMLSILPLFSIIGRLLGGYFLDRFSMRLFTAMMILLQACSHAALAIFHHEWLLMLGLAAFGLSVGNLLMLQPLIVTHVYGLLNYARIYSLSNLLTTLGIAIGPGLMGFAYALSGSYYLPFLIAGMAGLISLTIFWSVSSRLQ